MNLLRARTNSIRHNWRLETLRLPHGESLGKLVKREGFPRPISAKNLGDSQKPLAQIAPLAKAARGKRGKPLTYTVRGKSA